jgi:DNA-binding transcriptional LysR family regulator
LPPGQKNVASGRREQNLAFGGISFLITRTVAAPGIRPFGSKAVNSLLNLNAFVRVARLGSFSGAARELGVAPSVITKRIDQLEQELGTRLLVRSTRGLTLTPAAETLLPRFVRLAAEFEELFRGAAPDDQGVEGHLRIKSPTTVTSEFLGGVYAEFMHQHPNVTLEIVLVDRSVNPLEEGFDCSIGALPVSYPNVVDVPLCPYELVTCCAPAYLRGRLEPRHPTELIDYDCLTTTLFRTTWVFESPRGALTVDVHSRLHACDGRVIRDAARRGLGIAALARYLAEEDLRAGRLVPLLPDFRLATHWVKALVPQMKMNRPVVRELIAFLKTRLEDQHPVSERRFEALAVD